MIGLTGRPFFVFKTFTFADPSPFISTSTPFDGYLVTDFSFYTTIAPGLITAADGGHADDSSFSGTLQLTCVYSVPELSSGALYSFALGSLIGLGIVRRKAGRSNV